MILCANCGHTFSTQAGYESHGCAYLLRSEIAGQQQLKLAEAINRLCDLLERKLT